VLVACWSPKGGTGTSTFVAATAVVAARERRATRIADFAGDLPALLGASATGAGVNDWLAAGGAAPAAALTRIAVPLAERMALLPAGRPPIPDADPAGGTALACALRDDATITIADLGRADTPALAAIAAAADVTLAVVRTCYLSLTRLAAHPSLGDVDGLVLVTEKQRPFARREFELIAGRPVVAMIPVRRALARAIDMGLLTSPFTSDRLEPWRGLPARLLALRQHGRAA
jgi:hypothetical protein